MRRSSLLTAVALLVHNEGLAVGAFALGGVHLVGAHLNLVQRAVVGGLDVVLTLGYGAGDAVVGGLVFHVFHDSHSC